MRIIARLDVAPWSTTRGTARRSPRFRLMQQQAAIFFTQTHAAGRPGPQFGKDEFDAFVDCGILGRVRRSAWGR